MCGGLWPCVVPATLKGEARDPLLAQGWEGGPRDTVSPRPKTEKAQEVHVELEMGKSLMMLWFPRAMITLTVEAGSHICLHSRILHAQDCSSFPVHGRSPLVLAFSTRA